MHRFPPEPHRSKPLRHVGSLIYNLFPVKRQESWMHVILVLGSGLGSDHKETTKTHSDLNWPPQQ
jgi:hypothetical protein